MPSDLSDKAKEIMSKQQGHCAQAIFATYSEHLGLGKIDFDRAMKIASAFSGGIARTGNVCGALNGALMVLGYKYGGPDSTKANELAVKLLDEFKSVNGSTICRELINHDLVTDEDVNQAFKTGAFDNCPKFVEDVAMMLDKLLLSS